MKAFFCRFLPAMLVFVFANCSDTPEGPGNPDVNVPSCGNKVDGILQCAIDELKKENWDEAVAYYNMAYDKDNNDPRAIIYSALANLAKISIDPKMVALMKDHFGFTSYPNKLNALLSDKWMKKYPDYIVYGYYDVSSREWVYWEEAKWGNVDKDGYYTSSGGEFKYNLVSTEPKYEYDFVYEYYDESSDRLVYWEEAWWGDVDEDGYYDEDYNLVSTEAIYDSTSVSIVDYYYDESSGKWVSWEEALWGDVDIDGYYTYSYKYNYKLVSTNAKYDSTSLPVIKTPEWLKGQGSVYNNALLSGNVMSADNWALSLLANVIDKNSSGFNPLLDNVIDGVFDGSYKVAVERLKKLENKKDVRIKLDPYFTRDFGLDEVFDENDQIGWAEANAIVSAMLLVKASLEWVQSYDLSTDLNWLKYSWKDDPNDIKEHFKKVDASKLPFNNNFLNARPGKMANAKADYVKAIEGLQSSYASIINSELYPTEVKKAYATINDGFSALINAIENGGKFYIPEDPTKDTWPTSKQSNVEATIDLGKFFTEGYFSLQKIFETESGKPVFYLEIEECDRYWDCNYRHTKLDKDNYNALISNGGRLSLAIKIAPFSAIADKSDDGIEYFNIGLNRDAAKAVFEKYYP